LFVQANFARIVQERTINMYKYLLKSYVVFIIKHCTTTLNICYTIWQTLR
jgi:hypothetical protein